MNELHFNHWTSQDKTTLGSAQTFKDLAGLAMSIIARMPSGVQMVSRPISTGGVGSISGNRKVFEYVIEALVNDYRANVFSQMPFENKMVEFYRNWHAQHPEEKYCTPILDDFYEPVFSSGKIVTLNFISGWESSFGAKWEHDSCTRWNIARNYLPEKLSQKALVL